MRPAVHVLTLAVRDLERSLAFYRALGFESEGIVGTEFVRDAEEAGGAAVMFALPSGLILALYGYADLAQDAAVPAAPPGSGAFSIGHLARTREEVDEILAAAVAAGATQTDVTHERPWGIYSGYFRDPDGHLWEIILNPATLPSG
ncbi:MAG: VOC family protein [Sporichthyaceae bacterium]|jgi:catechol 2,3-dioxygenase-like lactoylglutathione lyase family enzyme